MLPKLIVIAGTNASGKSGLGVRLARRYGGEVVSADSRQVFRGLDLGSGKITPQEMAGVPHHLIDVREPGEFFSMADFQRMAYEAIDGILARGRLPFLVGGTGLYVDAVADGYQLVGGMPDLDYRRELETLATDALYQRLREQLPDTDVEPNNRNRVMRLLEKLHDGHDGPAGREPRYQTLRLGVTWDRAELGRRIDARLKARLDAGMADEVRGLLDAGVSEEFLLKLGLEYRFLTRYALGETAGLDETTALLSTAIKQFAKRQMTWFRRDKSIHWLDMTADPETEACGLIDAFLKEDGGVEKLRLVAPSMAYAQQVMAYRQEFLDAGDSMDGTGGLREYDTAEKWLDEVRALTDDATVPDGWVRSTQWLCVRERDDRLVGMIQVRHRLNDYLAKYGGHIGYSVRPSERRKGYAKRMLADCLRLCRAEGLARVLITCDVGNEASRRTIVGNGGVYDGTAREPEEGCALERYWVEA